MSATLGPLLLDALERVERASSAADFEALEARFATDSADSLPVLFQLDREPRLPEDTWQSYAERVRSRLEPLYRQLEEVSGMPPRILVAANALSARVPAAAVADFQEVPEGRWIELDAPGPVLQLDDAGAEVGLPLLLARHPNLDGRGVTVAVLDSGIDIRHPALVVAESVSTCGEPITVPGGHATHVAGCLASNGEAFRGVAPGVRLLNVKVTRASNPDARPGDVLSGIDEALDRGAGVISMSLGFNHFPRWVGGGAGWTCPDGRCPLCTAVDNAFDVAGTVVVAAAGNEHQRAKEARASPLRPDFDTELICPGQSRQAIAVGALLKREPEPWFKSSHGPSSYGLDKPDLSAPGVNVTSTVPVPPGGQAPAPGELFGGRRSGTSVATPMVAGAAALLIQQRLDAGQAWTSVEIREELLQAVLPTGHPLVVGAGRLDLAGI